MANLGLDQIYLPCPLSELLLPPFRNQSTHAEFTSSTKSETATIGEPCPSWPVAAKAWTTPPVVDVDVDAVPSRFPPFVSQLPKTQGLIHMSMISSPRPSWSHFDPHKLPTGTPDFERGEQFIFGGAAGKPVRLGTLCLDAWTPSCCHKRPSVCDNTPKFHISTC